MRKALQLRTSTLRRGLDASAGDGRARTSVYFQTVRSGREDAAIDGGGKRGGQLGEQEVEINLGDGAIARMKQQDWSTFGVHGRRKRHLEVPQPGCVVCGTLWWTRSGARVA